MPEVERLAGEGGAEVLEQERHALEGAVGQLAARPPRSPSSKSGWMTALSSPVDRLDPGDRRFDQLGRARLARCGPAPPARSRPGAPARPLMRMNLQQLLEADREAVGQLADPAHGEQHAGHEGAAVDRVVADRRASAPRRRRSPPGGRPGPAGAPSGSARGRCRRRRAISSAVRFAVPEGASSLRSWCSSTISHSGMWRAIGCAASISSTAPIAKLGATKQLALAAPRRPRAARRGRSRWCRRRRGRRRRGRRATLSSAVSGVVKSTTTSASPSTSPSSTPSAGSALPASSMSSAPSTASQTVSPMRPAAPETATRITPPDQSLADRAPAPCGSSSSSRPTQAAESRSAP